MPHVADDADDITRERLIADDDALPDRLAALPEAPRHRFVDDGDGRRFLDVARGEEASTFEFHPDGAEIIRGRHLEGRRGAGRRVGVVAFAAEAPDSRVAAERQAVNSPYRLDAGQRGHARGKLIPEIETLRPPVRAVVT